MGAGRVLCVIVMTFYVDACALVYFQFHPQSVGRSQHVSALRCRDKKSGKSALMMIVQKCDKHINLSQ